MTKKNTEKKQQKEAVIYENGKAGGANFREYQKFVSKQDKSFDRLSVDEKKSMYIEHLIKTDGISKRGAERIMEMIHKRGINNSKEPRTESKKITEKLEDGKDKVKIGKELNYKQKAKLDKGFNKWLGNQKIDNRDRDDIYILLEKYLSEKSNLSEHTKNQIRTSVSFFQDEKYQKKYKNSEIKSALKDASKVRHNTKNDIIIPKNLLKQYSDNINHIDSIFRTFYSKDAVKPTIFKEKTQVMNFLRWYTLDTNGAPIQYADKEHYKRYIVYMKEQGYAAETQHYFMKSVRKYAKNGEWEYKIPKKNKIFNLDKRTTGKVERAWTGDEFIKAFEFAATGTGKAGGCKRPDVALYLLTTRVFGERADECLNMTTEQFRKAVEEQMLRLTKTKGNRPRDIPKEVIELYQGTHGLFRQFFEICDREGINKPFIELFERHDGKKTHNVRASYGQWVTNHRRKFQDEDRIKRSIINQNMAGKLRNEIEIERAYLTLHGLRHSLAQDVFELSYNALLNKALDNPEYADQILERHRQDGVRTAIKRKWRFSRDYSDPKNRKKYLYAQIAKEAKVYASETLGHSRADVVTRYLTAKVDSKTSVKIDIETLQTYVLFEDEEGRIHIDKLDDMYDDILDDISNNIEIKE